MIQIIMLPAPFDQLTAEAVTWIDCVRGAAVFRQDDAARGMFWVARGRIDLVRFTEAGTEVVLHRAGAGQTFAEASLFSPRYHCNAVAAAPSRVAAIDKSALIVKMRSDPEFALALMAQMAGQVQGYRRRLELLAIRSAEDRVLAALSDNARYGTVLAFAARIGLTHEATYRALSRLTKDGRIEKLGRGRYRVARVGG